MSVQSGARSVNASIDTPAPAPFEWVREIATGGMGSVQLVLRREGTFRRLYAVKRLLPHLRTDDDLRAMFLDEARVAGLLRHPNVVSVLDIGEDVSGPYLVMDYVEGISLAHVLKRAKGTIPIAVGLQIVAQAAAGLHAAHELKSHDGEPLGLIHRDVSPQNLLLGFDGRVRVTDFGVAKAIGQTTATAEGILKGKLGYMSPEQLRFRRLDRRSDLFSLGVVLYEVLVGSRLYVGESGVRQVLEAPPPDVGEVRAEVPPAAVELCMQLLAKERDQRPSTARDVAERLEAIVRALRAEDGGSVSLEAYMQATFDDVAEERRGLDGQALVEVEARGRSERSGPPAAKSSRPTLRLALALLFGAAIVTAAVYALVPPSASDGTGADRAARAARPPERAPLPVAESAPAEERRAAPTSPADEASTPEERPSAEVDEVESEGEATRAEPRRRRPPRARRARTAAAPSERPAAASAEMRAGQVPQWGWDSNRVAE